MVTINQLLEALDTAGQNHKQIKATLINVDPNINTSGEQLYPLMRIFPDGSQVTVDQVRYRFAVAIMDRHREDFMDAVERISDMHTVMLDIYSMLRYVYRGNIAGSWNINDAITPFYDDKTDIVAGVAAVIEFVCPNLRDYCETPNNNLTFPNIN
jgi:hypothetical protein